MYNHLPSLVIATADKLAMIAYRSDAGALLGRRFAVAEREIDGRRRWTRADYESRIRVRFRDHLTASS